MSPCAFLQRAKRVVEAWFRVKTSDLGNAYGKFNIGLKHRFSKPKIQPHPSSLHSHSHTCMSFCTHTYGKSFGSLPDNGLIFNL